jgi:amidase
LSEQTAELQSRYQGGGVSVSEVTAAHLGRIEAIDPRINSVVTVNPDAMREAARLDAAPDRGPLFGIPVLVKDNVDTAGIATAFGSAALSTHVPAADAHLVTRLRDAGAVVLGKTTMPDFAMSWHGRSTRSGVTRNPYDLSRDAGGSSSGSAAAVAAGLAVAAVGTDTGGSIRVPASFCGLVGIRPTVGLVSRQGVAALVREQDSPGPLARSVADAAALLDAMAGWDPADPFTAIPTLARQGPLVDRLVPGALQGARIGVLREFCEPGPGDDPEVASVIEGAFSSMRGAGARLIDVEIPNLTDLLWGTFMYLQQSRRDVNHSLAATGASITDIAEIVASGHFWPTDVLLPLVAAGPESPYADAAFGRGLEMRAYLQQLVAGLLVRHDLDALTYPTVRIAAPTRAEVDRGAFDGTAADTRPFPTNTLLAAQSASPAITVPAGTTAGGLPVGLELLGRPHSDGDLVALAFDVERISPARAIPALITAHPGAIA